MDEERDAKAAFETLMARIVLPLGGVLTLVLAGYFFWLLLMELTEPEGLTSSELIFWGVPGAVLTIMGIAMIYGLYRHLKKYPKLQEKAFDTSGKRS